jgi:hypothetical protein
MISRPINSRYFITHGGIDNLLPIGPGFNYYKYKMASTYDKLYFNLSLKESDENEFLFVYDTFNRIWWCENGEFETITNFESDINKILMATTDGRFYVSDYDKTGNDHVYVNGELTDVPIPYIFQTKVYGAEYATGTKSLREVWFQANAKAKVYLNEVWSSINMWSYQDGWTIGGTTIGEVKVTDFKKIGELENKNQEPSLTKYNQNEYEQQVCYVEKMFGQRVNAFSLVVLGEGKADFYLMQRKWRINANV